MKTVKITVKVEYEDIEFTRVKEVNASILGYKKERERFIVFALDSMADKINKDFITEYKDANPNKE